MRVMYWQESAYSDEFAVQRILGASGSHRRSRTISLRYIRFWEPIILIASHVDCNLQSLSCLCHIPPSLTSRSRQEVRPHPMAPPKAPPKATSTSSTSSSNAVLSLWNAYNETTSTRLKTIDAFLFFLMLSGIIQFVYCILVTNFPFNAFLAGCVHDPVLHVIPS